MKRKLTENQRKLSNYIISAMMGHHLSFADLKVAVKEIKKVYLSDGILKCSEDHIKPLDKEL